MLYFIPTPIGNLEDISKRAERLLFEATTIFCEDTRVTKSLLNLLSQRANVTQEPKEFISLHSHNEKDVLSKIDKSVFDGVVAYVSDAGMPCISDPGAYLVQFCQLHNISYEVVAGANALLLAYASSGFEQTPFTFFGFLPHKGRERELALNEVLNSTQNGILYESPHRIEKLIEEISTCRPEAQLFLIKEATKKFEKKLYGTALHVKKQMSEISLKGEWVVVIKASEQNKGQNLLLEDILELSLPPKQKAKLLAKLSGESSSYWYDKLSK